METTDRNSRVWIIFFSPVNTIAFFHFGFSRIVHPVVQCQFYLSIIINTIRLLLPSLLTMPDASFTDLSSCCCSSSCTTQSLFNSFPSASHITFQSSKPRCFVFYKSQRPNTRRMDRNLELLGGENHCERIGSSL